MFDIVIGFILFISEILFFILGYLVSQAKVQNSDFEYNLSVIKEEVFNISAKLER